MPALESHQPPQRVIPADLPYERGIPWYARKRNFYLIIFLLMLNVVATTSITWGPVAMKEFEARLAVRRAAQARIAADAQTAAAHQASLAKTQIALAYDLPAGQVVYSSDSAEAVKLLAVGGYGTVTTANQPSVRLPQGAVEKITPPALLALVEPDVESKNPILFLHGRSTPESHRQRLIIGEILSSQSAETQGDNGATRYALSSRRTLRFSVYADNSVRGDGQRIWQLALSLNQPSQKEIEVINAGNGVMKVTQPGDALRILTAQPHKTDASCWYIDYTYEGKHATIIARLREDDRIDLELPGPNLPIVRTMDKFYGELEWDPNPGK